MCENLLGEFLKDIIENPNIVDFPSMINILIHHSQSSDELLRVTMHFISTIIDHWLLYIELIKLNSIIFKILVC